MTRRALLNGASPLVVAAHCRPRRFRITYRCVVTALEMTNRKAWSDQNQGDITTLLRPLLIAKGIPASRVDRGDSAFESYAAPQRDALLLEFP